MSILHATLDILKYLQNTYGQEFADRGYSFYLEPGKGHLEFYQYGQHHIAVCIYNLEPFKYKDLFVTPILVDTDELDAMIKAKLKYLYEIDIEPVRRRIKL